MHSIVCVDSNFGIGRDNNLLVSLKSDLKRFKELTVNNIVVMGSSTYLSLPKKPLPNRLNIVISRNKQNKLLKDAVILSSVEEVLFFIKTSEISTDDVYIIGGQSIYELFLPYCDDILLTKINKIYESDRFFPNIDVDTERWVKFSESELLSENGIEFSYINYKNKKKVIK